jgi:Trk K+ transport system NAD-binding subunit
LPSHHADGEIDSGLARQPGDDVGVLDGGSLIISDITEDVVASGETELLPGDTYLVAVRPEVVDEVKRLFRG